FSRDWSSDVCSSDLSSLQDFTNLTCQLGNARKGCYHNRSYLSDRCEEDIPNGVRHVDQRLSQLCKLVLSLYGFQCFPHIGDSLAERRSEDRKSTRLNSS